MQETADDIVASVLATAGARVSTGDFSTRRIAQLTGLSQTLVSRAVRRIRGGGAPQPPVGGGSTVRRQLVRLRVEYPRIVLAAAPEPMSGAMTGESPHAAGPRHAVQRRAAAVMAALWVSGAAAWRAEAQDASPEPLRPPTPGAAQVVWDPAAGQWEDFLAAAAELLRDCTFSAEAIPGQLLDLLARRAGQGLHGVDFIRSSAQPGRYEQVFDSHPLAVAEYPAPGRSAASRWLPRTALSATEQIAVALRKEMISQGFGAGDRIVPAHFARRLRLPAGAVRTAMRQLADDGLLDSSGSGFRVPSLSGTDVVDLYAARLQVGTVILRGCAAQPRHRLLPARLALGALEAAARQGSRADVGEADLRFQQELADASGLQQSARSFHALTLRLRMFISVLQLDYSPAVDRLVGDGRRLLSAVLEQRGEDAVRIWRSKLDDAVRHMSALAPDTFDAALWARLTR